LLKYFSKEKNFIFILITISGILEGEYKIPQNIKRISLLERKANLFEIIKNEKIDILVYNYDNRKEIEKINKSNFTKVIFTTHSSFFYRIYSHSYKIENTVYQEYKNCKYVTSLIPLENDYLFKKWGINSILLENPCTYEYDSIKPSDLSKKNIIMIGRGSYLPKRFELGIKSMKTILQEIPECKMNIISSPSKNLEETIKSLNLGNNVKITGFNQNPEKYLKNSSLHIMTSLSEAYPMSLGEVKVFGIPSILCGLDYLVLSKGGNIIIYDDDPDTIAKEAIILLKNDKYRKILGKEARLSMKKLSNHIIVKKWIKLFRAVYNGIEKSSYSELFEDDNKRISEKEADNILSNQLNLIKKRINNLSGLTLEKLKSFELV
jgi:glycosyltransferase involved in cell wall biosynthesis